MKRVTTFVGKRVTGAATLISAGRCQVENSRLDFTVTRSWGEGK